MTDREFALLIDRIDSLDKRIDALTTAVHESVKSCEPFRESVSILDSQDLDKRVTKVEHNIARMIGAAFGGTILGGGTVTALIRLLGVA